MVWIEQRQGLSKSKAIKVSTEVKICSNGHRRASVGFKSVWMSKWASSPSRYPSGLFVYSSLIWTGRAGEAEELLSLINSPPHLSGWRRRALGDKRGEGRGVLPGNGAEQPPSAVACQSWPSSVSSTFSIIFMKALSTQPCPARQYL